VLWRLIRSRLCATAMTSRRGLSGSVYPFSEAVADPANEEVSPLERDWTHLAPLRLRESGSSDGLPSGVSSARASGPPSRCALALCKLLFFKQETWLWHRGSKP
jgi:hypothetical protein